MSSKDTKVSYEEAVKELGDIVMKIESGTLPMEQALQMLEKAKALMTVCYKELDRAKGKLTEIKETINGITEVNS